MISQNLQKMISEAMKARDEVRLSTLRMLSSALNYEKINKQHDLTEEEEQAVIRKQAKQRKDSIDAYEKLQNSKDSNIQERIKNEKDELKILNEFLPPEMEESDLQKIVEDAVDEFKAGLPEDAPPHALQAGMGKVIGAVKSKAPDVEGGRISELVKQKLT